MVDLWNGQPLPDRRLIRKPLTRRADPLPALRPDRETPEFQIEIIIRENPAARIRAVQFDGPA